MDTRNDNTRLFAGTMTTVGLLATGHWFPWWKDLDLIQAYTWGTLAIALGHGVYYRFNRRWRKSWLVTIAGGLAVIGAHVYDAHANHRVNRRVRAARGSDDEQVPIS